MCDLLIYNLKAIPWVLGTPNVFKAIPEATAVVAVAVSAASRSITGSLFGVSIILMV